MFLDDFEWVGCLLCLGLAGFCVGYRYCAVFGGYGGFWVESYE
jgi:hypothetical protein